MNEQLFILCQDDLGNYEIRYDDKVFHFLWEVAPILNEQQATIQSLKSDKAIAEDYANIFEKENVKLRKQIGEQQATISDLKEENEKLTKMLNANYKTNNELVQYIQMLESDNDE